MAIQLHKSDNVMVAAAPLNAGAIEDNLHLQDDVPAGHKFAIEAINHGDVVRKYGQIIGHASQNIAVGEHVHTHNLEFRAGEQSRAPCNGTKREINRPKVTTFDGFPRVNGKSGTRNYIAILISVNCSATAARYIADRFNESELGAYPNVDGVAAFVHATGCGMADDGAGFANLQRVLWGYARNPNIGGVLLVGLGCEINQIDFLLDAYGIERGPTFRTMNIQDLGGLAKTINAGVSHIREMLPHVNQITREPCPISDLVLGLQCGGSDAWSGITANPGLGYASDLIVAAGGTTVLAETPEIYGAEHLLLNRTVGENVGYKLRERITWWENYTRMHSGSMDNNPSPGNKSGGLTTILEKSLGAIAKGGTSPLNGVFNYGEMIDCKGLVFMDSPGFDPCSVTGQIASGCNIIAFTTGRGSAFGSKPAPSIKIGSNNNLFARMPDDIDINAGTICQGELTVAELGQEIFDELISVASGKPSKSEAQGLGDFEFVPWQIGATM